MKYMSPTIIGQGHALVARQNFVTRTSYIDVGVSLKHSDLVAFALAFERSRKST
jgi:hypothetical protein